MSYVHEFMFIQNFWNKQRSGKQTSKCLKNPKRPKIIQNPNPVCEKPEDVKGMSVINK
jgi:hypothetical protein